MFNWTRYIECIKNWFVKKPKAEVKTVINRKLEKILKKHKNKGFK